MNYTPDANEMAARYARQEAEKHEALPPASSAPQVRGTLTVWKSLEAMIQGQSWLTQSHNVVIDLSRPGLLIAYDDHGDAEIFSLLPGWYSNFVPNREGE